MNINLTSRDFEVTEGIRSVISDKVSKLDKFDVSDRVEVVLSNNSYKQQIELTLTAHNKRFSAKQANEDLYKAIDAAVNAVQKQIRRHLDMMKNNHKESIRFEKTKSSNVEKDESEIVKRKRVPAKPMFEAEAILQMEMLNHRSFMFHNADTDSPCMIYKRNDGNYGIIETI